MAGHTRCRLCPAPAAGLAAQPTLKLAAFRASRQASCQIANAYLDATSFEGCCNACIPSDNLSDVQTEIQISDRATVSAAELHSKAAT